MQPDSSLQDLTRRVLEEIKTFDLSYNTISFYRQAYGSILKFAVEQGIDSYSDSLVLRFMGYIDQKHRDGKLWDSRRDLLRRAALLLKDYATDQSIEYKRYKFISQHMPSSIEFLHLHSDFLGHLRSDEQKSKYTIDSCRNAIRQFLLFLEDNDCSTFSLATPAMINAFFRHLHSTYRSTSIRTVASHVRLFLRYVEGGELLLPAVPSHCARAKTIIPILSNEENDALRYFLQNYKIPLRDNAIMLLALRTGLRSVDIVGMKLGDIDWNKDTISIIQSKTKTSLRLPLLADVGNALSSYILKERPKSNSPFVFLGLIAPFMPLSGHSVCYAIVKRTFRLAAIRTGDERKGIHIIRHSAASRMLSKGIPVTLISSMLGHKDKTSTDVYLSTDEERMKTCGLELPETSMDCGGLI